MLVALADSFVSFHPEGNDILIIALSTGQSWSVMTYYVLMTITGSVIGCSLLYTVGRARWRIRREEVAPHRLEEMRALFARWGIWDRDDTFDPASPYSFQDLRPFFGVFQLPFPKFLALVFVGRSIRYFMWGILGSPLRAGCQAFPAEPYSDGWPDPFCPAPGDHRELLSTQRRTRKKSLSQEAA